ncbi:Isochorismatase hydrolase [Armillaria gallica]|uniref:Isochorismatase hydrolase n=1 Tax=Armillaria gallica TaxID=47427 RepID=A0A2H3EYQ9_ARMGA|nr:Isochorismatase-like protein [Armillaria nabsnona]PBL04434.1 Isochorismatase hydrolase [Armillaria gallica]
MPGNTRRVLLILDAQKAALSPPPTGIPSSKTVSKNITQILETARSANPPPLIIHIRTAGDVGEPDEPNTPGWELVNPPLPNEPVIDKKKNNAFAGTILGDLIVSDAEIVVVGLQSDFSLRATCSAALDRGNEVLMVRGAHGTYDRLEVLFGEGTTTASAVEAETEAELEEAGVCILEMKDLPGIFNNR